MAFNIETFKNNFRRGGARPNLFEVQIAYLNQTMGGAAQDFSFTCRAGSVPAWTMGTIEVPYFGRKIKVQGDRTYAEWTATVINDEKWNVRTALERWNNALNTPIGNVKTDPYYINGGLSDSYKQNIIVKHYAKRGEPAIANYTLFGAFPSEVGAIELAWDTNDTIEEYTVTFQYDYFVRGLPGNSTAPAA